MSHIMADLITPVYTSSSSSSSSSPFISLRPLASVDPLTHPSPSRCTYRASFPTPFHSPHPFPSWPHALSTPTTPPVNNSLAFRLVTRALWVEYDDDDEAASFMQPAIGASGDDEEDEEAAPSASIADRSLVLATHDHKEGAFAGLTASGEPIIAADIRDADKLSRIWHAHSDAIHTDYSASSEIMQAQKGRAMKKKAQQLTYLFAALASSVGITSLAGASVYCRFAWQMQGGEVPWAEMCGTFSLALGAAVGMEYWARWAHRALWHASLWSMHKSHHQPRDGPFELNDVFAIINAVPAILLMAFGFLNKGLVPGLCFGAGLGITVFGIAYMFVHDGLVHRRFPVGPIADVPYFQKVAAAHQLHHADKFNGVPYGLFLGPMELEEVGGQTELEKALQKRKRENKNPIIG